jgi:hypothetical protein
VAGKSVRGARRLSSLDPHPSEPDTQPDLPIFNDILKKHGLKS